MAKQPTQTNYVDETSRIKKNIKMLFKNKVLQDNHAKLSKTIHKNTGEIYIIEVMSDSYNLNELFDYTSMCEKRKKHPE